MLASVHAFNQVYHVEHHSFQNRTQLYPVVHWFEEKERIWEERSTVSKRK